MKLLRAIVTGTVTALTLAAAGYPAYARLKSKLNITPDQEQPWQTFSDQVKQQAQTMKTMVRSMKGSPDSAPLTAPEQMRQRVEFMKQRLSGMEAVSGALDRLYAVLTPEQRSVVNAHFARMHPGMGKRRS